MHKSNQQVEPRSRGKGVEGLDVWWRAREMVVHVYHQAAEFPASERYGLSDQLRRAAVSVVANIAEGHGRLYRAEYYRHVSIALGSLIEVQSLLIVSTDLGFRTEEQTAPALEEIERVGSMLTKLAAALRK